MAIKEEMSTNYEDKIARGKWLLDMADQAGPILFEQPLLQVMELTAEILKQYGFPTDEQTSTKIPPKNPLFVNYYFTQETDYTLKI